MQMPINMQAHFEDWVVNQAGNSMEWYNLSRIVREVQQPIFWAHDSHDESTPFVHAEHLRQMTLPHIEFFMTEGLGHTAIYKDNRVKKAVLGFWQKALA